MRCTREGAVLITSDLFNQNNVLWKNSMNTTTERVDALTAIPGGFQAKVTEITPNMTFTQRLAVEATRLRPEVHQMRLRMWFIG